MNLIWEMAEFVLGIALIVIAFRGFVEIFYWWKETKESNSHIVIVIKVLIAICTISAVVGLTLWPIAILGATAEIASIIITKRKKEKTQ